MSTYPHHVLQKFCQFLRVIDKDVNEFICIGSHDPRQATYRREKELQHILTKYDQKIIEERLLDPPETVSNNQYFSYCIIVNTRP